MGRADNERRVAASVEHPAACLGCATGRAAGVRELESGAITGLRGTLSSSNISKPRVVLPMQLATGTASGIVAEEPSRCAALFAMENLPARDAPDGGIPGT